MSSSSRQEQQESCALPARVIAANSPYLYILRTRHLMQEQTEKRTEVETFWRVGGNVPRYLARAMPQTAV